MQRLKSTFLPGLLFALIFPVLGAPDEAVFFTTKVAPILEQNCYKCHSHDGKMKGGLTLDSRSGWVEGGDTGPAIIPGKPEESLLIKAVRQTDPDLKMPPKDKKLADHEIAVLVEWISRGAPDPRVGNSKSMEELAKDWWSLNPLVRPEVPDPKVHPVDAFIRKRLRAEGIKPAPPADRRRLVRRLYIGLHGLPPTPEQARTFVADTDPKAWEKQVDALLASPRYGERWARHWLDTIHFADSHGCEHDVLRPNAWRFRDYVIDRLNRDVSWDRFIREQLAADVFYPDASHLIAGLGFIAAGPLELSRAGTAPVTFDYLDRDDMVTQTMAAFVSTTANCARCHTHKFDPITQEDYYALQAVFAGVGKGDVEFEEDPALLRKRNDMIALKAAAAEGKHDVLLSPQYAEPVAQWLRGHEGKAVAWESLSKEDFRSGEGSELVRQEDGSILSTGKRPEKDTYTVTGSIPMARLTAIRLDVLSDDRQPMKGPGRQDNGNLHLSEFEAKLLLPGTTAPVPLKIRTATADWNQAGWTIAHALDGNPGSAWGIYPKVGVSHHAVFELEHPVELKPDARLEVTLKQLHGGGHLIGRFRIAVTDAPGGAAEVLPVPVIAALKTPGAQRTRDQQAAIASHVLRLHAERELAGIPGRAVVYAVSPEWSHAKKVPKLTPKLVHVLKRGNIDKPGKVAQPGALSALKALPGRFKLDHPEREATRRAALADWIADPDNPLTWRSIVNRVWHYHFGRGLCDTPNDFGRMGGTPSHPELVDWLAAWFRDDAKGSLKALHRLILTSETYRQSSRRRGDPRALEIDAENRLLWRMQRQRLDAECYRDSVLQISGRIDLTMGGPGVEQFTKNKGRQSTPVLDYGAYGWDQPGAARRSIYRVVWRGIADPFMEALDFPDMAMLSPKRGESISALQALTLFNNDFVLHHSGVFSRRIEKKHPKLDDQVRNAFLQVLLREPDETELAELGTYAQQHGLAALARVLFNSNEFLFVD